MYLLSKPLSTLEDYSDGVSDLPKPYHLQKLSRYTEMLAHCKQSHHCLLLICLLN